MNTPTAQRNVASPGSNAGQSAGAAAAAAAPASMAAATSPASAAAPAHPELAGPTGRQFELRGEGGHVRAVVTELGAMLRVLEVDGVALIEGFGESDYPQFCAGWMLIPWPNRVRDGLWSYDGRPRQLPVTEPERGNALHGLVFDLVHTVVRQSPSSITLRALIEPSDAYPFALTVDTTFEVGASPAPAPAAATAAGDSPLAVPAAGAVSGVSDPADPAAPAAGAVSGVSDSADSAHPAAAAVFTAVPVLTVTHAIANTGDRDAPVAIGAHPYFRIGDVPTEQLVVTVDAVTRVSVDARLNPTATAPVAGTPYDLRAGVVVGGSDLDTAYLDLTPAADGRYRHTIAAPDSRRIELWGDENYSQAQVFTTPIFPTAHGPGWAVTVEPTTAPPDALNTGENLRWVAPGETWSSSWGIDFAALPSQAGSAATDATEAQR